MGNLLSRCCVNTEESERKPNGDAINCKTERTESTERTTKSRSYGRGATIVSNSVKIGTVSVSIGKNAENVTINHFGKNESNSPRKSASKTTIAGVHEDKRDIFSSRYSAESAAQLENKAFDSIPAGNFIDNRNVNLRDYMYVIQELEKFSHSVCQIRFPGGTGTGFRVGSRYIMTAYHVVKGILSAPYPRIGSRNHIYIDALQDRNVYCSFEYFKSNEPEKERKYYFNAVIHFKNEETDTAVLELADNSDGTPMPPPFELFGFPDLTGRFTLMGHEGSIMEYNTVERIIDKDHRTTKQDILWVKEYNSTKTSETYEFLPHNTLTNKKRILFHCKFSKGASGSPGIVILENGRVVVVTMLVCGYPNWYYDERMDQQIRSDWPKEYCIEQGTDMLKVGDVMRRENSELFQDIFCREQLPTPAL